MRLWNLGDRLRSVGREAGSLLARSTLPETCAGCGVAGAWFCADCRTLLAEDDPPGCQRCGRRGTRRPDCPRCGPHFPSRLRRLRAGFAFDGPMRRAVHRFKYTREYARGRHLGQLLANRYRELFPRALIDVIVPVPLHPRRFRERGFNQSSVLAEELSVVVGAPVVPAVSRARNTVPQAGLSGEDRLQNLSDAFVAIDDDREAIAGMRVLIVDDVTTTGATAAAVAEALQAAGAAEIFAITLAREQ